MARRGSGYERPLRNGCAVVLLLLLLSSGPVRVGAAPPLAFTAPNTAPSPLAAGELPWKIAAADMNGDTFPDLVTTFRGSGANGRKASVFLATVSAGAVTGYTRTDYVVGRSQRGLAVGDLNGDGKPDIATVNADSSSSITVLRSTTDMMGNVTGCTRTDYPAGSGGSGLAIADLNGDGRLDFATTNTAFSGAGTLRVLLDNGMGGYTTATQAISTAPNDVTIVPQGAGGRRSASTTRSTSHSWPASRTPSATP